jgi:MFS family permease
MSSRSALEHGLGWLYDQINGEEDARVCKDIPDKACVEQPVNFFAYLLANVLNKISDELSSARLTLPWLFSALGVPAAFVGFLVPIREAGVLLPQLLVAAYVRALPKRKVVWLAGALLSALMLLLMALVAWQSRGVLAGWLLLACLTAYSLARGLCSVSAKDVLGKTVSKTRRGRLMGYSASLGGVAMLVIGLLLQSDYIARDDQQVIILFITAAAVLWLFAFMSFMAIREPPGATEGGGNALVEALKSLRLVVDDRVFRQYLVSRVLMLSIALAIPFYVILMQQQLQGHLSILGWLIIASGLASSLSAPLVGKWADHNSRQLMVYAALLAGVVGIATWTISSYYADRLSTGGCVIVFFLVTLCHSSVRLGRKVYLVDMANTENRARYVAVSNTLVGIAMLLGGIIGVIADLLNVQAVILLLSVIALVASVYTRRLANVSG